MDGPPKRPAASAIDGQAAQFESWLARGLSAQQMMDRLLADLKAQGIEATGSVSIKLPSVRAEGTEIIPFQKPGSNPDTKQTSSLSEPETEEELKAGRAWAGLQLARFHAKQRRKAVIAHLVQRLDASAEDYAAPDTIGGLPLELAILVAENEHAIRVFLNQMPAPPPPPRTLPALTARTAPRYITAVAAAVAGGVLPANVAGPLLYAAQLQIAAAKLYPKRNRPSRAKQTTQHQIER